MGEYNSSVTRVWPVFDFLLGKDPTGVSWLPALIGLTSQGRKPAIKDAGTLLPALARFERTIPSAVASAIGVDATQKLGTVRNAFEVDIPPSVAFLRWLIENPSRLTWPKSKGSQLRYGIQTQKWRQGLVGGDPDSRDQALKELESLGVERSRRRWWAFEGFTSVDCYLETESLVLLIEGKRTEPISASTSWYPERNQVVRNLEVARALAGGRKEFAVMLCTEEPITLPSDCWERSLPHLSATECEDLEEHYWGCVCWPEIAKRLCSGLTLPHTVPEAIELCLHLRSTHS